MNNKNLIKLALEAAKNAYAPYSNFFVGASIELESGEIITGCNVENSSYGLTLCAERNAISTAISKGKSKNIKKIAIASPNSKKCYPCGACRQWIDEFSENATILIEDDDKIKEYKISELLPFSFNKDNLR